MFIIFLILYYHAVDEDSNDPIDEDCELNLTDTFPEDYYENVAKSAEIRPIAVTEDVDFSSMSTLKKIFWWFLTSLKLLR